MLVMSEQQKVTPPIYGVSAAEFRCHREQLGLSRAQLAQLWDVAERRIARWEVGSEGISPWAVDALRALVDEADDEVATRQDKWTGQEGGDGPLVTFQNDDVYAKHGGKYPASWHRAVTVRVSEATGQRIRYHPDDTLKRKLAPWEVDKETPDA